METTPSKLLIIIPMLNEEETIESVLHSIEQSNPGHWDTLVVNDCSVDDSLNRAEAKAKFVLDLPLNLGIGGAVQAGFRFAKRNGYRYAVQVDADGQHDPTQIKILLDKMHRDKANVIVGSRFISLKDRSNPYRPTMLRLMGIKLLSMVHVALTRNRIYDTTSGFRLYDEKAISLLSTYYPHNYPEPESLIWLNRNKLLISEVAVHMENRKGGKSSLNQLGIGYMLNVLLGMSMSSIRPKH